MNDKELDQAIAALPGAKVTKEGIEDIINDAYYFVLPGTTVTICSLTLYNGYSVRGESACVDTSNFNKEIGRQLAYKDAFKKIWALEGYRLAEAIYREATEGKLADTRVMPPSEPQAESSYIQRMMVERAQLTERVEKLAAFLQTPTFKGLDSDERTRMKLQHGFMTGYLEVLQERIRAATEVPSS